MEEMPGWNTVLLSQDHPHNLKKILWNIEELKKLLKSEDSLIDVGCCEGHLHGHLRHPNYLGIDLFERNVERARTLHPGVEFKQQDLFSLEGQWDIVWCCRVLMHLPKFEEAVEKLRSCSRKHCLISIPIGQDLCAAEMVGEDGTRYYRSFSKQRVLDTNPSRIVPAKNGPYATVIYDR